MAKVKIDKDKEYIIAVVAPKDKTNYHTIMSSVIKAIGTVEYQSNRSCNSFVFLHDGVTSGSTGYVIETVNKISLSAQQYDPPRMVTYRKLPLDIELHGKRSHYIWIDEALALEPDLVLVINNGQPYWRGVVDHARRASNKANIICDIIMNRNE